LADALNKLAFIKQTLLFDTIVVKADAQKLKAIAEKNEMNFFISMTKQFLSLKRNNILHMMK
jgi:hypothetical protein